MSDPGKVSVRKGSEGGDGELCGVYFMEARGGRHAVLKQRKQGVSVSATAMNEGGEERPAPARARVVEGATQGRVRGAVRSRSRAEDVTERQGRGRRLEAESVKGHGSVPDFQVLLHFLVSLRFDFSSCFPSWVRRAFSS